MTKILLTRMLTYLSVLFMLSLSYVGVKLHLQDHETTLITLIDKTFLASTSLSSGSRKIAAIDEEFFEEVQLSFQNRYEETIASLNKPVKVVKKKTERAKAILTNTQKALEILTSEPIKVAAIEFEEMKSISLIALYQPLDVAGNDELVVAKVESDAGQLEEQNLKDETKLTQAAVTKDLNDSLEPVFVEVKNEKSIKTDVVASNTKDEYTSPIKNVSIQSPLISRDDLPIKEPTLTEAMKISSDHKVTKSVVPKKKTMQGEYSLKSSGQLNRGRNEYSSLMSIQFVDVGNQVKISNFEVRIKNSRYETISDYGKGIVAIDRRVAGFSVLPLQISNPGYLTVNTEIEEVSRESFIEVPAIMQSKFEKVTQNEFNEEAAQLLIEVDTETKDIELSKKYSKKLYLNDEFKQDNEDYRYVLFTDLVPGNIVVTYKRLDKKESSKILYLAPQEITFDVNYYEKQSTAFGMREDALMSKEAYRLNISSDKVTDFYTGYIAKKTSLDQFVIQRPVRSLGSRNYVELKHLNEPVYVGFSGVQELFVPDEDKIKEVMRKFHHHSLESSCLVQINLTKKLREYDVLPESVDENILTYSLAQDLDGKFYETIGEKTERIYILGENQGTSGSDKNGKINVHLKYADGSAQSIGTYCSPQAYLVEQL